MPHPHLTELYNIYQSETQPFRKVHRMIDLFESLIKMHTVVIIVEYVGYNKLSDAAKGMLAQGLRTPSLGTWQLFSRILFEELQQDGYAWTFNGFDAAFTRLDKALNDSKTNVIAFRNGYAHGATPTDAQCSSDISQYEPFLLQLLQSPWLQSTHTEHRDQKVWISSDSGQLCLHPILLFKEEAGASPYAFFNDLKNDKVGLLNYPLNKHYREKDFYNEFHQYFPLHEWKKTGNNEFYQRIEELTETFKGRTIEREKLLNFVVEKNKGYLSIQGNPGIGKSALIAQFFKDLMPKKEIQRLQIFEYFIRRGTAQAQVEYFFNYLIRRTDEVFSAGKEIRAEGKAVWDLQQQLFSKWRLWGKQSNGSKLLFLIDGLDEGVENNVVSYLPRENFESILIIYGSRPGGHKSIDELWAQLPIEHHTKLELSGLSKEDIRALIYDVTNKYEIERDSSWIDEVQERSQGNPLYLKLLCDAIEYGSIQTNDKNALPEKIDEYYKAILLRYDNDPDGDLLLKTLFTFAATFDYLTFSQIEIINSFGIAKINRIVGILKEVLTENPLTKEVLAYQLFHEGFRSYLIKNYQYEIEKINHKIVLFCQSWKEFKNNKEFHYFLKYYIDHLLFDENVDRDSIIIELIKNSDFEESIIKQFKDFSLAYSFWFKLGKYYCDKQIPENIILCANSVIKLSHNDKYQLHNIPKLIKALDLDVALKIIFSNSDFLYRDEKYFLLVDSLINLVNIYVPDLKKKKYLQLLYDDVKLRLSEIDKIDLSEYYFEEATIKSINILISNEIDCIEFIKVVEKIIFFDTSVFKQKKYIEKLATDTSINSTIYLINYLIFYSDKLHREEGIIFLIRRVLELNESDIVKLEDILLLLINNYYSVAAKEIATYIINLLLDKKDFQRVKNVCNYSLNKFYTIHCYFIVYDYLITNKKILFSTVLKKEITRIFNLLHSESESNIVDLVVDMYRLNIMTNPLGYIKDFKLQINIDISLFHLIHRFNNENRIELCVSLIEIIEDEIICTQCLFILLDYYSLKDEKNNLKKYFDQFYEILSNIKYEEDRTEIILRYLDILIKNDLYNEIDFILKMEKIKSRKVELLVEVITNKYSKRNKNYISVLFEEYNSIKDDCEKISLLKFIIHSLDLISVNIFFDLCKIDDNISNKIFLLINAKNHYQNDDVQKSFEILINKLLDEDVNNITDNNILFEYINDVTKEGINKKLCNHVILCDYINMDEKLNLIYNILTQNHEANDIDSYIKNSSVIKDERERFEFIKLLISYYLEEKQYNLVNQLVQVLHNSWYIIEIMMLQNTFFLENNDRESFLENSQKMTYLQNGIFDILGGHILPNKIHLNENNLDISSLTDTNLISEPQAQIKYENDKYIANLNIFLEYIKQCNYQFAYYLITRIRMSNKLSNSSSKILSKCIIELVNSGMYESSFEFYGNDRVNCKLCTRSQHFAYYQFNFQIYLEEGFICSVYLSRKYFTENNMDSLKLLLDKNYAVLFNSEYLLPSTEVLINYITYLFEIKYFKIYLDDLIANSYSKRHYSLIEIFASVFAQFNNINESFNCVDNSNILVKNHWKIGVIKSITLNRINDQIFLNLVFNINSITIIKHLLKAYTLKKVQNDESLPFDLEISKYYLGIHHELFLLKLFKNKNNYPSPVDFSRHSSCLSSWIDEFIDEDDRDQIKLWAKQVSKGKITEEDFKMKIKSL